MKKLIPALMLAVWAASACGEETPTGISEGLLPVSPTTVEVRLPWGEFASGLQVFGGFGSPFERGIGVLANDFRGLQARTVGRWGEIGLFELVEDTTGTVVEDDDLEFTGGVIRVVFDTLASRPEGPVTVAIHHILTRWHGPTATWTLAVDSVGEQRPWPEAGGGPAQLRATATWDREQGDTLAIAVDAETIIAWADTADVQRGFRVDVETEDVRLEIRAMQLSYDFIPSVKPDTILSRTVFPTSMTFLYTPEPGPPASGLRVGGIPAWRSVIHLDVPTVLTGPPEFCEAVTCPFQLTPERINHASLVLQSRPTDPPAFQPSDSVRLDVRPVFSPERLPRAPLGAPIAGPFGRAFGALRFQSPTEIALPITGFVRSQVAPEPPEGVPPPRTIALLAFREPASIAFATFAGPDEPGAPFLRLIVTTSSPVELP